MHFLIVYLSHVQVFRILYFYKEESINKPLIPDDS